MPVEQHRPKGKILLSPTDKMPPATFSVLSTDKAQEAGEGLFTADEIEQKMSGDSSLGDALMADGVIKSETEKGKDVFIVFYVGDDIKLPDNLLIPDEDEE